MTQTNDIPAGYWKNARGNLVPESKVKDIEKLRDQVVRGLFAKAVQAHKDLVGFKIESMQEVTTYAAISQEQYGVKTGGDKGNITLTTFDGELKIIRQMQEHLVFGEQLQAAKQLIDGCVTRWSKNADDNIKVLVNDAFQVDQQGKINTGRVLGLRRLEIQDADWLQAMKAIDDSIQVASTKPYIRFYQRDASGEYQPINLDLAAV